MLVRADADVAAVPGQRETAGGRAAWEGAGWFALEAATLRGCPPQRSGGRGTRIPAQAPSFLVFAPDLE